MAGASTRRRRLAALLLAGSAAAGTWTLVDAALVGADTTSSLPQVFQGIAGASGVHEEETPRAGLPVYQPFYGTFADGYTVDSPTGNNQTGTGVLARASTFFPGATFGNPASLVCQINCIPGIPTFPLTVATTGSPASVSQQSSTPVGGTGQPASGTAASATATAYLPVGPTGNPGAGVASDAVVSGMSFPGAGGAGAQSANNPRVTAAADELRRQFSLLLHRPIQASAAGTNAAAANPSVMFVGSATASTFQHFDSHGTLFATADSRLSGISMLAGLIQISSIDTTSNASGNGGAIHTHSDHVAMGAVTVGGVPATIGSDGISVTGQGTGSAPVNALNSALQQALAAAGMSVTLTGPTAKPAQPLDGCGKGQADGVNVTVTANANAVPFVGDVYNLVYTLGSTCASVQASNPGGGAPAGNGGQPLLPVVVGNTGQPSAPPSAPVAGSSGPAANTGPAAPTAAPAVVPTTAAPRPTRPVTATTTGPLTAHSIWTLYLAVVLAMGAVLVGAGVQLRPMRVPASKG